MPLDGYASQPHYLDHLAPVWHALEHGARGRLYLPNDRRLRQHANRLGLDHHIGTPTIRANLVLVAGAIDLTATRRAVLLEHGAGQTYRDVDHQGWAGGKGRGRVVLFVCPNERAAETNAAAYPDAHVVIAAPRVEQLRQLAATTTPDLVACFSRHWDSVIVPELRSAWPEYAEAIFQIVDAHPDRYAFHAHPRARRLGYRDAQAHQLPFLEHFDDVVRRAIVYVVDNSSTGYEWAALDRPVLWLNHSGYRRDVEHGLRFWDQIPGCAISSPKQLAGALLEESLFGGGFEHVELRRKVTEQVYPIIDGSAALVARTIEMLL